MKLRLLDDSVRLRLGRQEVALVGNGRRVEATTRFPDGTSFRYALTGDGTGEVHAGMRDGILEVTVPRDVAARWAESDEVGITAELPLADGRCRLQIEKDFTCLHPRADDLGADTFPNPSSSRDRS